MERTFNWNSKEGYTKEQLLEMGFTFTLNGDIVTPNEESKHLKEYLDYRKQKLIDKACEWLESALRPYVGYCDTADIVESFRKAMKE